MKLRIAAAVALTLAVVLGVRAWNAHLLQQGDSQGSARVQSAWDKQEADRSAATARDNATKFRNSERVANEDAKREAARLVRDAAAAAAVRGLHHEISRLNKRTDPYPAGDAGIAACTRDAATARELFGHSAQAYSDLAAAADGLRDQVTGLQDFARSVCRAPITEIAR
ncbi:DUF2514 domain-containing protein [Acidovorax sp. SUPP2522]|uniref:hypothetical protein n=1 Tax=unclassified Acidovorax TaxID=2684926 RepID=UPI00234907D3|nr:MULTISPECIES: hypothetical protein [unclassified Acidovorax]WCM96543.1 hypothetical protein M5C96_19245 [Acidovorax sp. GBBC 1281]GKT18676.1 DUF2514 domain-containing protein [Acidovorax sp. SUPP2522]